MDKINRDVTDPAFYDNVYYAAMDLRYLNNIHSGRFWGIKKNLHLVKDKKTLDIGCGGGGVTNLYSKATKNLIGIDFSPSAVEFAKMRYPHLDVRVMDVFNLKQNFAKGELEVVIANDVIEHVHDHDAFLENCSAVLEDNGCLIITTDLDDASWTRYKILNLLRLCLIPLGWDGIKFLMLRILELPRDRIKNYHDNHVKTVSQKDLIGLIEKHGFTVEKTLVYNLTKGIVRDFVLNVIRIITRLELRDHQLIVARKKSG